MKDPWVERWNERYRQAEFAYGELPNIYFREQITKIKAGKILLPAEGEGRNAVYAAMLGWEVSAFDLSEEGKKKALLLAKNNKVSIHYQVGELHSLDYKPEQFDVIALIYAHFPAEIKSSIHRALDSHLKSGGYIIFEAFSKKHLDYLAKNEKVGGPRDIGMLFSLDEIKSDFPNYNFGELEETEIELNEGAFHNGLGSVIRFVGRKV